MLTVCAYARFDCTEHVIIDCDKPATIPISFLSSTYFLPFQIQNYLQVSLSGECLVLVEHHGTVGLLDNKEFGNIAEMMSLFLFILLVNMVM